MAWFLKVCGGLLALVLLAGCASALPEQIRRAPAGNPELGVVRTAPERYIDSPVRWGGTIARVDNLKGESRIEIVARELLSYGEPRSSDRSAGRFLAYVAGFIDPAIYASGRAVTVSGTLRGSETRLLDQMEYLYPVVRVTSYHLWPEPEPLYDRYPDPFFYDPWYPFGYPYPYPYLYLYPHYPWPPIHPPHKHK